MKRILSLCISVIMLLSVCSISLAEGSKTEFYMSTSYEGGTFSGYDSDGEDHEVEVDNALILKVEAVNCKSNNVHSGTIEVYYDETKIECIGCDSETGGMWVANTGEPGKVKMAFSTGTQKTKDGLLLACAFENKIDIPEEEELTFTLDVVQLFTDKSGSEKVCDYDMPEGDTVTCSYNPDEGIITGDASLDGVVNTADAVVILKYSANLVELTESSIVRADVNKDKVVNTWDAVMILQYCASILAEL